MFHPLWTGEPEKLVITGGDVPSSLGGQRVSRPNHLYHGHTVPESSMPTVLLGSGLRKLTVLLAAGHGQVI